VFYQNLNEQIRYISIYNITYIIFSFKTGITEYLWIKIINIITLKRYNVFGT